LCSSLRQVSTASRPHPGQISPATTGRELQAVSRP